MKNGKFTKEELEEWRKHLLNLRLPVMPKVVRDIHKTTCKKSKSMITSRK